MRASSAIAGAAAALVFALAGCGGDERDGVESTLRGFLTDVYDKHDFEGACDRLAPAAVDDLVTA